MILSVVLRTVLNQIMEFKSSVKSSPFPSYSGSFCYFIPTVVKEEFLHTVLRIIFFFFKNKFFFFKKWFYVFVFTERGREGDEKRNINVWLPLTRPLLGTWPTTQACVPTGNPAHNPSLHRLVLNPLSHTSQGCFLLF